MTLRMLWPLWVIVIVFGPLLALTIWQAVRHTGGRRRDWFRRAGIVAGVVVIGLCPAVPDRQGQTLQSNAELFFVVDRTGSMAAEDWNGGAPRLDGVRNDLVALTEAMAGARYSIIGWDSQATRQLPLTTDARAVRSWADTLRQEVSAYSAGTAVDRPLEALRDALEGAAERNPGNVRLVFFLSDGENTNGDDSAAGEMASYEELAPLVDGGAVLGYGTSEGGRMRMYDGTDATGAGTDAPFITDPTQSGSPDAISRIDETTLRTIAEQLGVEYSHRIEPSSVDSLVSGIDVQDIASDGRREVTTYTDVYWPAALVVALLLAWEAWSIGRSVPAATRGDDDGRRARARARSRERAAAQSRTGAGANGAPALPPLPGATAPLDPAGGSAQQPIGAGRGGNG
ncbi:von Willebrand factor type A [Beutenbergia cavernae DSM 12333]|uniref:von Willebrand factor type A n=1 Tax=Beutenbergia cavernae (strain ATCC BAA-8 / DSM 12333 / CCUG 43141 / JCM 11478 / NBRC 16432 / NCIMB 13614 / HKI 0122) TaxID=471853 RepID=C5C562_BEUC1|nr:VWA domain-containing protein [Beutenbergia cavernae]ACQ82202.1 von Willebrand factor type A [Beutenbergia cavernae DSM 12333]